MKTIISQVKLSHFKNETHVQFNETVDRIFIKYISVFEWLQSLYSIYKPALDNEIEALDVIRKSEISEQIVEQDKVRDETYRGLVDTVKAATNHFNPAYREAAKSVATVLEHYGNITRKTFDDETAAIKDLDRELKMPAYAHKVELLELNDWLNQLLYNNSLFEQFMMDRYSETAEKTPYRMKTARAETDRYFRAIISQAEILALINYSEIEQFAKELNAVIDRFKAILTKS